MTSHTPDSESRVLPSPPAIVPGEAEAVRRENRLHALDLVVRDSLVPIAFGLAIIYAASSAFDFFLREQPAGRYLAAITLVTAAVLTLLGLVWRARPVPPRWAHCNGSLMAVCVCANQAALLYLTENPAECVYLMGFVAGIGTLALRTGWMLIGFAMGWCLWLAALWLHRFDWAWGSWFLPLAVGTSMGVVLHVLRLQAVLSVEELRRRDACRAAQLQQTADRLARSEALFRAFADHSGQVFWINDRQPHHATYVNRVYETLFGRTIESLEADPMDWITAVHPDDRARVLDAYVNCLEHGEFRQEYRIIRSDGAVRWVRDQGFLIRADDQGPARVGGIVQDITEQVESARQLKESEKTNFAILRALPDLIMRYRRDGTCLSLQAAREFNTLWPQQSPVGTNVRDALPADLAQRVLDAIGEALDTGNIQTVEYNGRHEGGFYWREARLSPVGPDEVVVVVRDFTARRLAEEALAANRQKLTDLVTDINGIVWEADVGALNFTFVSPRAEVIMRYPLHDWRDDPQFFRRLVHPDDFGRTLEFCRERTEQGIDHELDYRVITADGRTLWVNDKVRVIKDESGRPVRLRGIIVDMTDATRAAQALRDSQMLLARSQEIAQVGSWTWDAASQRVVWSSQMYAIHDLVPGQFDGSWLAALALVHPEDQANLVAAWEEAIRCGKAEPVEYRIVRGSGSGTVRLLRADAELEYDAAGQFQRVVGTVQDVTDIRRAEAERARLEEELRQVQKLEAIGTLASGVAHDFNNLLTAINGYSDLAAGALQPDHPSLKHLNMIQLAARHAGGVIRSLLTFAHGTPAHKSPVHLARNIRETLQLLRRLLPANIELIEDIPADLNLYINADGHQLQQVWMNLTINARDAMPKGGRLTIRIRRLADAPVSSNDSWIGSLEETALITVADTGTGMSEETIQRIFEPYYTTKPRGQGTGLGLSILHGILTDHQGRVRVESHPDRGTQFTLYLPCCDAPSRDESSTPGDQSAPLGRGETILLAEDNDYVRDIIHSAMTDAGYDVLVAADGDETMRLVKEKSDAIRLIVLDLDLPRQSGEACLDSLRKTHADTPVIIITANSHTIVDRGLRKGESIVPKPFQVSTLLQMVSEMLRKQGMLRL